jgi:hypothetical protein
MQFLVLASVLGSFALYTTHAQYGGAAPVPILGQSGGSPGGAGATPWYVCIRVRFSTSPLFFSASFFFFLSFIQSLRNCVIHLCFVL